MQVGDDLERTLAGMEAQAQKRFEVRVTAQLMRKLGFSKASIGNAQEVYSDKFGCAWFNTNFSFPYILGSFHVRRLSFSEIIQAVTKTVIWEPFSELVRLAQGFDLGSAALIFNIPDHGTWVATNDPSLDRILESRRATIIRALPSITIQIEELNGFCQALDWDPH